MDAQSAHASWWKTSDAIVGSALAVGLACQFVYPLHVFRGAPAIRLGVGLIVLLAGVAVIVAAKRTLRAAGQPAAPGKPTTDLVASGVFRFSRNPMYLGLLVAMPGLGLVADVGWYIALTPALLLAFKHLLILPEEAYLARQFGETYRTYASRVRRWI